MGQVKFSDGATSYLFEANGNSPFFFYGGDKATFELAGTFGSGTITMQASLNGDTWVADPDYSATSETFDSFVSTLAKGTKLRFVLAGATSPSINVIVIQSDQG